MSASQLEMKTVTAICLVLMLYTAGSAACPTSWSYNDELGMCTHPIVGEPPYPHFYCTGLQFGASVQTLGNGAEICGLNTANQDGGMGAGGGLPG